MYHPLLTTLLSLLLYSTISFIYFVLQEKTLSTDELAEMPSCYLAKTVHNKWLQASGNKGGDLYVATVDDYIRAFLQVVAYYQVLKGGIGGVGPSKEELKLRWAQRHAERTGDLTVLQRAFLDMLGAEDFCTREPHLEGAEVFGLQKQKPDTPIGADSETHRPDTINFSCPRLGKRVQDLELLLCLQSLKRCHLPCKKCSRLWLLDSISVALQLFRNLRLMRSSNTLPVCRSHLANVARHNKP